jgi:hypothetical protein
MHSTLNCISHRIRPYRTWYMLRRALPGVGHDSCQTRLGCYSICVLFHRLMYPWPSIILRMPSLGLSWCIQHNDWASSLGVAPTWSVRLNFDLSIISPGLLRIHVHHHRAVDNQVFFSMCSPARDMSAGYHAVSVSNLSLSNVLTDVCRSSGGIQWSLIQCKLVSYIIFRTF